MRVQRRSVRRRSGGPAGWRVSGAVLAAGLVLAGCSGSDGASTADSMAQSKPYVPEGGGARAEAAEGSPGAADRASGAEPLKPGQLAERKVIRTAELSVRVEDVSRALATARAAAESVGGMVGEESTERDDEGREHSEVVLRVPQDRYAQVLERLGNTGTVLSRNTSAQDVTEKVVDVETRLKNQRASVARLRELMDRATRISDVVALEGELSSRQAELESLLAQQESLKGRVALATVTLSLTEGAGREDDGDDGFVDAVGDGWGAFLAMLRWVTVALGAALPFLVLGTVLAAGWRRLLRPWRQRRAARATAVSAGPVAVSATGVPVAQPSPAGDRPTGPPQAPEGGERTPSA
ncbi:DUF4349 domain-containing protein [Streptomyces sp. NPDC049906]|uniref:DUF4349 domain-containing protein n=1 Tax=Streptomyces sp. NPDC049906 TaxID=3155656 RepID=UPI003443BECC